MDRNQFWTILDKTIDASNRSPEKQQELIKQELMTLDQDQVEDFGRTFTEFTNQAYTWDLWGAAYVIFGGCSDDTFSDFRGWLVAQGKEIFLNAVSNPESLSSLPKIDGDLQYEFEGYNYLADEVIDQLSDTNQDSTMGENEIDLEALLEGMESGSTEPMEPEGEQWTEEELPNRYPELCKIYEFG